MKAEHGTETDHINYMGMHYSANGFITIQRNTNRNNSESVQTDRHIFQQAYIYRHMQNEQKCLTDVHGNNWAVLGRWVLLK